MTEQEKIEALMLLAGYEKLEMCFDGRPLFRFKNDIYTYNMDEPQRLLSSHDALQPILEEMQRPQRVAYLNECHKTGIVSDFDLLIFTPTQKADCILKACGLWKD